MMNPNPNTNPRVVYTHNYLLLHKFLQNYHPIVALNHNFVISFFKNWSLNLYLFYVIIMNFRTSRIHPFHVINQLL